MVNPDLQPDELIPDPFADPPPEPPVVAETQAPEVPPTFGELTIPEEPTPETLASLQEELAQAQERYETLKAAHQALTEKLAQVEQQYEEQRSQMVRLAADFDNYRRRVQREQEEASFKAKAKVLEELLAVVDNFERARTHIRPETEEGMAIHKNYQGVYKQMVEELKKLGVAPIPGKGQPFDPNRHEAVLQEASAEYPEGVVIEELRRGYFLKQGEEERILRHALVKVSTGAAESPAD
ncbi:MAG: nucleotide exchange factor GrpE [Gloeomargarita sp. HHBFW_bins_162]